MLMPDGRPRRVTWDYDRAELIADGIVHAVGLTLGFAGAIAILIVTAQSKRFADLPFIAVYAIGLLSMLGLSAAYNTWPVSQVKWWLRRFDHSAIYLMIAGTYTAFIGQLKGDLYAAGLLSAVWLTAAAGVAIKLLFPGRFDRAAVVLYLLLGWSGVLIYQPVAQTLPALSIWLIVAGGGLYSTGVIFHGWRNLRFQNAIWHGFVLIAAACHYTAILYAVANGTA
jgi:hemolysin III